jgi:hypothetical protein
MPCFDIAHLRDSWSIKTPSHVRSSAPILAAASLGAVLVLVATSKYGVAAVSDSAGYISVARSLAEGRGFMDWRGGAGAETPPFYPAVLALFEMVGVDALVAARWLNATLLAGLVLVAGFSLCEATGKTAIPTLVAFGIAVAPVLLNDAISAMSDLPFIVLAVSCLVVLVRHLRHPSTGTLLCASVLAALAFMTRYAGFALVATGCLLLVARRGRSFIASLRDAAVFGVIAWAPMVAWLARNYFSSGTLTGERVGSPYSFAYLAEVALQRIGQWFVPPRAGPIVAGILGTLVLAGAAGVLLVAAVRDARAGDTSPRWWETPTQSAAVVFAAFTLIYVVSITGLLSVSFATSDPRRIVGPALPTTLMLVGLLLARAGQIRPRWAGARLAVLATALLLIWPSRYAVGTVRFARRNGAGGIASEKWQKSGTIAQLGQHVASMRSDDALIYSNEPTAIYLLTDLRSVNWLPPHDNPYSPVPAHVALETFAQQLPKREPTYIVLFDDVLRIFTYSRALVEATLPLEIVHSARDGVIYRVRFRDRIPASFRGPAR